MTRTGEQLLQSLSEFINDYFASTTTSAGNAGGTTLVDTALMRFGDGRLAGRYARGSVTRRINSNAQASGTAIVSEPFTGQVAGASAYTLHRYDPALKFRALDAARLEVMDYVFKIVLDDTLTGDGQSPVFDLPSAVQQGPHIAYFERPVACASMWNFLSEPELGALTGWTAASVTATTVAYDQTDLVIPKYTDRPATKLVVAATTAGTYRQVVGSMTNDITAAKAAGRKVAFLVWVYSTAASRVTLSVLTDAGTLATGTAHQGKGWELLYVEGTVAGDNATTLTASLEVSSGAALTLYAQRAWLYFGGKERVFDAMFSEEHPVRARADDTQQHIMFDMTPPRGHQIRIQGKAPLTALGDTVSTQGTNSMEVDERTSQVVIAKAAQMLLDWNSLVSDDVESVQERIAVVSKRFPALARNWRHKAPKPHINSPFAR